MIVHPENRGTSIAVAMAILTLRGLDAEAIVASLPCDHHYSNDAAFLERDEAGIGVARSNSDAIVLVGAEATCPETEYGWVEPVQALPKYRIAREALRNAFSHGRAHDIETEIVYAPQLFRLRISDDGEGIRPAIIEEGRPGHFGLSGMRERAKNIGAKLRIWSRADLGTEIELNMPGFLADRVKPRRFRFRWFRNKREET